MYAIEESQHCSVAAKWVMEYYHLQSGAQESQALLLSIVQHHYHYFVEFRIKKEENQPQYMNFLEEE